MSKMKCGMCYFSKSEKDFKCFVTKGHCTRHSTEVDDCPNYLYLQEMCRISDRTFVEPKQEVINEEEPF